MKKVFELKKATREFATVGIRKIAKELCEGCTINGDCDIFDEIVKTFDTFEEAKSELKNCRTYVDFFSHGSITVCDVEEYYIKCGTYDEDGFEIIDADMDSGVWEMTKFPTEEVEKRIFGADDEEDEKDEENEEE